MNKKIIKLWETSKEVISDCCLENGAIVAANSTKPYFPKEAKNYMFVWPRDASYTCIAAKILGLNAFIQEYFFNWCLKAEDWEKTGLFYEKYFIDGRKARHHFQPDQTGSVLIAVYDYCKENYKERTGNFRELIKRCADGLCKIWDKDHFNIITQDLWEEKLCFPDMKENFTYSLAMCCRGLLCANELIPTKKWLETAEEMEKILLSSFDDFFYRSFSIKNNNSNSNSNNNSNNNERKNNKDNNGNKDNKMNDFRVDASLLGLVWPAKLVSANDIRMKKTVTLIEEKLAKNCRIHRYEHDEYDGWMYESSENAEINRKKGAGYWPLLNFWMAIYFLEKKDNTKKNKEKALKYYNKVLKDLGDKKHIPEQIFSNNIQVSVSPLCWSHSMFVMATEKLHTLQKRI